MRPGECGSQVFEIAPGPFALGEGPLWHPESEQLIWTDIDAGRIHAISIRDDASRVIYEGDKVGGMTLQRDGALLLFRESDVARMEMVGPNSERTLFEVSDSEAERFNDVLALPDGSVLAGMVGRQPDSGPLYHVRTDGSRKLLFRNTKYPNGMALDDDGAKLYYTDSPRGLVVRFDLAELLACNEDEGWDLHTPVWRCTSGSPDGLTMDSEGMLWSASFGGGRVVRLTPDGEERMEIRPGASNVTSCCFAGEGLGVIVMTTAGTGVYGARVGVSGQAEHRSAVGI